MFKGNKVSFLEGTFPREVRTVKSLFLIETLFSDFSSELSLRREYSILIVESGLFLPLVKHVSIHYLNKIDRSFIDHTR